MLTGCLRFSIYTIKHNDDYVRESTLDDYLEKIYKEQYSRKMSYTILDTILIKRYQLIERIGNP